MRYVLAFAMMPLFCGCGGSDDDDVTPGGGSGASVVLDGMDPLPLEPGNVRALTSASAPNLFAAGVIVLTLADVADDPTCPKITEEGDTKTYAGGCTDASGQEWTGTATIDGVDTDDATIRYDNFGTRKRQECQGASGTTELAYDGTMHARKIEAGHASFDLDLRFAVSGMAEGSCAEVDAQGAYDYAGEVEGMEQAPGIELDGPTVWNGSGRVGYTTLGRVDASTADERLDGSKCSTEALSGTTTLRSVGDAAVIAYDGATDCDESSTVTWTLNGKDQGELVGVRCTYGPATGRAGDGVVVGALMGLAAMFRRRKRQAISGTCPCRGFRGRRPVDASTL
jgi:hypothetical protein